MNAIRCLILSLALLSAAGAEPAPSVLETRNLPSGQATIDWTHGLVLVTAYAAPQTRIPPERQLVAQRRVAIVEGYRMLAEAVDQVQVSSETTVRDGELIDDEVRAGIRAFIRGAQVADERLVTSGLWANHYAVTLALPMAGAKSLSTYVLPGLPEREDSVLRARMKPEQVRPTLPPPVIPTTPPPAPTPLPQRRPGPYTGLVLDARGFGMTGAMAPKILRPDGTEVWGTVHVPRDFVLNTGIVGFLPSLDDALAPRTSRAGDNPLVLRAIGRQGSAPANAVVTDADADLLLAENARAHFLDQFKVIFVIDRVTR